MHGIVERPPDTVVATLIEQRKVSIMLRCLALKLIAQQERGLGVSLAYLRHIARVSLSALGKIALMAPLGKHRRALPADAFHVARLLATLREDCGACVQIEVNLARKDRVPPGVLNAVLNRQPGELSTELAAVYRFTDAVLDQNLDVEWLRNRLCDLYGEDGLLELSLAIATSRFFPTLKRSLGYTGSCSPIAANILERAGRPAGAWRTKASVIGLILTPRWRPARVQAQPVGRC